MFLILIAFLGAGPIACNCKPFSNPLGNVLGRGAVSNNRRQS